MVGAKDDGPWIWILHESPPIVFSTLPADTVWITNRLNSPAAFMFHPEIKLLLGSVIWLTPNPGFIGDQTVKFKQGRRISFQSNLAFCSRHQSRLNTSKLCWNSNPISLVLEELLFSRNELMSSLLAIPVNILFLSLAIEWLGLPPLAGTIRSYSS